MARDTPATVNCIVQRLRGRNIEVQDIDNVNERGCDCFFHSWAITMVGVKLIDRITQQELVLTANYDVQTIRTSTAEMLHHILLGHLNPENRGLTVAAEHPMREGLMRHVRHAAADHLQVAEGAGDLTLKDAYIAGVRNNLYGDHVCVEAIAYRYHMCVLVFMPPLPDCLAMMRGNPAPKVIRFNWMNGEIQKTALVPATDLGVEHFAPLMFQKARGSVPAPGSWKPCDKERLGEAGVCPTTNRMYQTAEMVEKAQTLLHCEGCRCQGVTFVQQFLKRFESATISANPWGPATVGNRIADRPP